MFPITMLKMMAFAERAWMSGLAEMVKIEHWEAFILHVVIWLWFMRAAIIADCATTSE